MLVLLPLLLALSVSAATFTVFDVPLSSVPPVASVVSFKPLGVGNDGTTYEIAQAAPTGPTLHQTIVANSVGIKASAAPQEGLPVGVIAECSWGADNKGACVGEVFNAAATETVSYTGSIVPIFTVTVDDSSAPASPTAAGAVPNSPSNAGASIPVTGSSTSASPTINEAATSPSPSNSASLTLVGTRLYLCMAAVSLLYLL